MTDPAQKLLRRLARELMLAETAVAAQAHREADRLGTLRPAVAMRDVAHHAEAVARVLPEVFKERAPRIALGAPPFARALAAVRRFGLDWLLGHERSYRVTLLGQRLGIDLVYELEHLAVQLKDEQLREWCRGWLELRVPLVTAVERQLQWFVVHPDRATERLVTGSP